MTMDSHYQENNVINSMAMIGTSFSLSLEPDDWSPVEKCLGQSSHNNKNEFSVSGINL